MAIKGTLCGDKPSILWKAKTIVRFSPRRVTIFGMSEKTDSELLREYAEGRSESAFETLLRRHIGLVYSAAVRMVVDRHLAEDVTQAVFVALAARSGSLSERTMITGWLHRTACNLAAKAVRSEVRRRNRERDAVELQDSQEDSTWKALAPILDYVLDELHETDRDVVLLRFFERKTAAEIGARLSLSEEAAQKRVSRAMEKLRILLSREGVCVSTATLGTILGAHALEAAPAALASTISAAALATASGGFGVSLPLLKTMTMTKLQVSAVSALIVIGTATPFLMQRQTVKALREENRALLARAESMGLVRQQTEGLSNQLEQVQQAQALSRAQMAELMRLRGEVALLRRESQELARLRAERKAPAAVDEGKGDAGNPFLPAATWANVGADNPEGALQTLLWAAKHRETNLVGNFMRMQRDPEIPESDELDQTFARGIIAATSWFGGSLEAFRVVSKENDGPDMMRLGIELVDKPGKRTVHNVRFVREENQWCPVMHVWLQDKDSIQAALDIPKKFLPE